ncbi:Bacterial Ig-like domain (group 2) [Sphingobacterium mizutaii]|uniref:Bacterial Ig-like domain (Group 2) n=1 Tax=Sphingobacterium mizutaii TaxID=1010 RepID=A0AAJ4XEV8_9SPHI|nr:Ig-like domain-containing protein [Sphingobacterium mizutaii]SDL86431.1 Ig-like domain (group 2) [Sphingobacterium mizutaii]SNV55513.1 Bacterial Ig-like domain (group 2) [Sphingobacterium mizutaii]
MKFYFPFTKYSLVVLTFVIFFISCSKDKEEAIPEKITKIEFIEKEIQLFIGKSDTLNVVHNPQKLPKPKYKWSSSNSEVVSVNELGVIKALKEGKSEITATISGENMNARVLVNVLPIIPEKLKLELVNSTLFVGDSVNVKYSIDPPNTTNAGQYGIDWSSSDNSVFTVMEGKVKGLKAGKAKLTATIKGTNVFSEIEIIVKPILPSAIELNITSGQVELGQTIKLIAKIKPDNTTDKDLVWESSDSNIASVVDGEVIGKKEGEVVITVKTKEGSISGTAKIKVFTVKATKITLNQTQVEIMPGQSFVLTAEVSPHNAHNKDLVWSSSNSLIATVDQYGNVIGKKEGEVVITVKTKEGSISATAKIKVFTVKATKITLNETHVELMAGQSFGLTAEVSPQNTHNKGIVWSSSNSSIATVDQYGNVIAKTEGTVQITAKSSENPNISASCSIKVIPARAVSISLSEHLRSLDIGGTFTIFATVFPNNVKNKGIIWSSSNPKIASVDQNGVVKAISSGTVEIIATSQDNPSVINSCTVMVKELDSGVKVGKTSSSITNINGYYTASITHFIANYGSKKITVLKMEVVDGDGIVRSVNNEQIELYSNQQVTYTSRFSSIYRPQFHYYFEIDGKQFKRVLTLD